MDAVLVAHGLNISFEIVVLALVSLGLAITLGLLGVLNLAHGEFVMIGAFSAFFVQTQGWPFLTAIPVAMLACAMIGWPVERYLIRPLYARPFDAILATWGLSLLLREVVEFFFGRGFNSVAQPVTGTVSILGADYPAYQLVVMGVAVVLIGAIVLWFLRSLTGRRIRAMVDNPDLARSVGIPTDKLASRTFVSGLCLAGLSGALLAPIVAVHPGMGIDYVLKSFFVLVVGGLGNILGLVVGSGVIGGAEAAVSAYLDRTAGYSFVLVLSLLFLWRRPNGLVAR
ncbi:branched-chain amino acid ABC transporter permease [Ruegeria sp.]|uniref:branched-chain amino acid ABC transporter permease n=1 Tax=Ruegeria sp. TaxID=1879320 RepID=UPI003B5CA7F7